MKFVLAAVVVLAVAMGVHSSLIGGIPGLGLGINGLGLGWGVPGIGLGVGLPGPIVAPAAPWLGAPAAPWLGAAAAPWLGAPAAIKIAAPSLPAAVNIAAGPIGGIAVAKQVSVASPLVAPGATYVAKTRGAIHTAPLAGHIQSAASVNVAPAPGTW